MENMEKERDAQEKWRIFIIKWPVILITLFLTLIFISFVLPLLIGGELMLSCLIIPIFLFVFGILTIIIQTAYIIYIFLKDALSKKEKKKEVKEDYSIKQSKPAG